ncbi:hypothetical protein HYD_4710 [Candidatus Hydrogenosomobacter endosymbioticus]|uniref:Uncharacterized protein n=1 Tax=Candidatus Hydrogenosomobacter endosymbioticus TaxID=2558174 RepID=A0ABM7V967_9PROT|nr:hypothetical protein HYD_4710 [Candidatus Hydrogenosomobacter endosymbioticus]
MDRQQNYTTERLFSFSTDKDGKGKTLIKSGSISVAIENSAVSPDKTVIAVSFDPKSPTPADDLGLKICGPMMTDIFSAEKTRPSLNLRRELFSKIFEDFEKVFSDEKFFSERGRDEIRKFPASVSNGPLKYKDLFSAANELVEAIKFAFPNSSESETLSYKVEVDGKFSLTPGTANYDCQMEKYLKSVATGVRGLKNSEKTSSE